MSTSENVFDAARAVAEKYMRMLEEDAGITDNRVFMCLNSVFLEGYIHHKMAHVATPSTPA